MKSKAKAPSHSEPTQPAPVTARPPRGARIVFKFGTGILTHASTGRLERAQVRALVSQVTAACQAGYRCVIVSSGAVGAGVGALGLPERPKDLAAKQACAAVGQNQLMRAYETAFAHHKFFVAQILLTHPDLDSRTRRQNAKNTLEHLLTREDIIPIINENDVVAVDEVRDLTLGDNDQLSVEVADLVQANLLLLLTSVDGLLEVKADGQTQLIPSVQDFAQAEALVRDIPGRFSTGGMRSKLRAAKRAVELGINTRILNGRKPESITRALRGLAVGTSFINRV
ncbi:MAG: glutamate 5-kinase [Verrucomicrobiales bacterium]